MRFDNKTFPSVDLKRMQIQTLESTLFLLTQWSSPDTLPRADVLLSEEARKLHNSLVEPNRQNLPEKYKTLSIVISIIHLEQVRTN